MIPEYGFKILDWKIDRNFDEDKNTEVIAWLKIKDNLTNRIINLRHDEHFYEDKIEGCISKLIKLTKFLCYSGIKIASFFVGDIEFRLDDVDFKNNSASMTKLIPDSEPITELLSIYVPETEDFNSETKTISATNKKQINRLV